MYQRNAELVRNNFPKLASIAAPMAALFYRRLFEIEPSTHRLFVQTDIEAQGAKLMAALGFVVGSLDRPERLVPIIQGMALRHLGYGVRPEHYAAVGQALLWTLERGLAEAFTPQVRAAWTEAYLMLSGMMMDAAQTRVAA